MLTHLKETTKRLIVYVVGLGISSIYAFIGYFCLASFFVVYPYEPIVFFVISLGFNFAFALGVPPLIERDVDRDIGLGRYFMASAMGLSIGFLFGVRALLWMSIFDLILFLTLFRLEALLLVVYVLLTFVNAALSWSIAYRFFSYAYLTAPDDAKTSVITQHLLTMGMPCIGSSVFLFALANYASYPVNFILNVIAIAFVGIFFVLVFIVIVLDRHYGKQERPLGIPVDSHLTP